MDPTQIEQRTDLVKTAGIAIANPVGGVEAANIADVIRMAELFARSGVMVPPHCRDKPGVCFALCTQAHEWGMPYLGVINKSYVVNNRGVERIAYESQLIHAVIEKNAPIKERLRYEIVGEGDERRCKVWATFKGSEKPHEYLSEALGKLRDARGRNDSGQLKGSPLWDAQPDVQLFYSASRQWARLFCPDVLLGAYTPEDAQYEPVDVTPAVAPLVQRLRDAKKAHGDRGFDLDHVKRETGRSTVIEGEAQKEANDDGSKSEHVDGGRTDGDGGGNADHHDQAGSPEAVGGNPEVGGDAVGQAAAPVAGKADSEPQAPKPQSRKRK